MVTDEWPEHNALGAFLRARREAVSPESVGLPRGSDRRVPGLRREEVALLAGVSIDYLNRLEQGRERHPSAQVLDAVARALRLDDAATAYLFDVASPSPRPRQPDTAQPVGEALHELLEHFVDVPAYVVSPALDILATNRMTDALYAGFDRTDNLLRMIFLDPAARSFYDDWEHTARGVVRNFRAGAAKNAGDARVPEVVGRLSVASPSFAALWAAYEVKPRTLEDKAFHHPTVGELHLRFQTFAVDNAPGQRLYVYSPRPGSSSADALTLLGTTRAPLERFAAGDVSP